MNRCWILICSLIIGLGESAPGNDHVFSAPQSVEVPIYGDGSAIIIDVRHEGQDYRFWLNTGSAITVVDSATFQSVLKPYQTVKPISMNAIPDPEGFENPGNLVIGERLLIPINPLYRVNLLLFSYAAGVKVHGILGCDFLNQFCVEANTDTGRLRITNVAQKREGVCVDLGRDQVGRPVVYSDLAEFAPKKVSAEFMVDTGSVGLGGITLRRDLFQSYVDHGLLAVEGSAHSAQLTQNVIARAGTLRHFPLWKKLENIQVHEKAGTQTNSIGLSYLMQFNFALDLPNSKLYLQPRKSQYNILHLKDLSGLGILREASDIVVRNVYPQSPAARSDIRLGDVVMSVDGVASQQLRMHPLRVSLCEEGKVVRLGMRRDTKEWTVDLELRDWRRPATDKDFE